MTNDADHGAREVRLAVDVKCKNGTKDERYPRVALPSKTTRRVEVSMIETVRANVPCDQIISQKVSIDRIEWDVPKP